MQKWPHITKRQYTSYLLSSRTFGINFQSLKLKKSFYSKKFRNAKAVNEYTILKNLKQFEEVIKATRFSSHLGISSKVHGTSLFTSQVLFCTIQKCTPEIDRAYLMEVRVRILDRGTAAARTTLVEDEKASFVSG